MTVAKEPGHRGELEEPLKTIGVRERRVIPVYSFTRVLSTNAKAHTRAAGANGHPAVPHALFGRNIYQRLGRIAPRGRNACLNSAF